MNTEPTVAITAARKLRRALLGRHGLLCDTGTHAGLYAVDLRGRVYLTAAECDELGVQR
jgi:hypothetical protein